jgi:two-component system, OmpR family, phosphate regulon sensor histidine kinase PhoR
MNRLPQIVGALSVLALLVSVVWTPWIAVATLGLICAWLLRQLLQRDRAALELLREPQGPDRTFSEVMMIVRGKLKDSEQHLKDRDAEIAQRKQITNAVPDGLFLLDPRGLIIWCNQAALVMHSLDAFRDMGKPITQLIRAPELAAYLHDETRPEPLVTQGGRSILFHLERGKDAGHDATRLLLTRDVTEREKLDRMRRDFVANVSHELRTPLTVVGGFVETLTELPLAEPERSRYLQLIATQTTNMRRLVEDLLTLARLENDQIPPDSTLIDIAQIAREALADAEALSRGAHTFVATIEPALMLGSASELRSALGNLLSNAVRYTPSGGRITLTVVGAAAGEEVLIEVMDSGVGIAAEHIPRLTERFYRIDRSRSRETGGTGLGLAIVKHIAQRHRTKLEIESEVGVDNHGSRFRLRFPSIKDTST